MSADPASPQSGAPLRRVQVTACGSGFTDVPTFVTTGPGSGAAVTFVVAGGVVTGAEVIVPGSGYTGESKGVVTGGGGTGATVELEIGHDPVDHSHDIPGAGELDRGVQGNPDASGRGQGA